MISIQDKTIENTVLSTTLYDGYVLTNHILC